MSETTPSGYFNFPPLRKMAAGVKLRGADKTSRNPIKIDSNVQAKGVLAHG